MTSRFTETFGAWRPSAVAFDCDGVLMDTESIWLKSQHTIMDRFGVVLTPDEASDSVGAAFDVIAHLIASKTEASLEQVQKELLEQHEIDIRAELTLMPGVLDLLDLLEEKQVPLAVASNSVGGLLPWKIERVGLTARFWALLDLNDVENPKPAPDLYALAVKRLGAAAGDTLAVEDSETGATAARGAGCRVLAVPSIPGQHPQGDLVIGSLTEPGLLEWVRTW